ncbi:MAG: hypothetical protein PHU64_02200 [Candidatus Omnitrophica bacterium]|nr:hypothetical protein [Candidatus Omnitrophota bacterium]MDD5429887.1 hypothetical protein [Candidatus Omnitrophota bacterium]
MKQFVGKKNIIILMLIVFAVSFSGCEQKPDISLKKKRTTVREEKQKEILNGYYKKLLGIKPQTPEDYMSRGFAYTYFKEYDKAKADFDKASGMYEAKADYESAQEAADYIRALPGAE